MRIATWNVNSLKARLEKVGWWLQRAQPDVLLLQETKLGDKDAPYEEFTRWGYMLTHHGEGRWNGVAIASKNAVSDVVSNFGEPFRDKQPDSGELFKKEADAEPLSEARMVAATVGGVRVVSIYAPNGREVGSPFFAAKLAWFDKLSQWLARHHQPSQPIVIGGDYNVAPADADVWNPAACHGGTHVSPEERAAFGKLVDWGLVDAYRLQHQEPERYSWWDYRAGNFHKNYGMRIDHCLVSQPLAQRLVWTEIDREARKGKPIPSDHAPVVVDFDQPGHPFDAGWSDAEARIAQRRIPKKPR
jgi:exodeoxyribonuclease-3